MDNEFDDTDMFSYVSDKGNIDEHTGCSRPDKVAKIDRNRANDTGS